MLGLWLALAPVVPPADVPPAEPPRPRAVELGWEAPSGCPDADAMRQRIADAVLDPQGEGTLRVEGSVEPSEAGYRLTLRTTYGETSDERTIEDRDCDALGDAAALVVAVSIDPATEPNPVPERVPEPEPLPEPEPTPQARVAPANASSPSPPPPLPGERDELRPATVALGIGGQAELGALPGFSGGPRLELDVQWRRLSIAAHGIYGAPRRTTAVRGVSGLAQLVAAGARGCGVLGEVVRVPLCAVIEAGGLRVESRGPIPSNVLRYAWTAAGAHVGVERRWGRVGLYAAGEALVPLRRPRVEVGDATSFTASPVSVRAVLGLRIFFDTDPA